MRKFRVSEAVERCVDIYVDAETADEARKRAIADQGWLGQDDDAWCDGHRGTERIDECVEANGDE